ncbi:MAG: hypothetical protein HC822_24285, partial [Oscillochloris sp.]|nr:hypothetical protein [Oscillochloris sp.]
MIWMGPHSVMGRLRQDGNDGMAVEYLDEGYQLWGEGRNLNGGFVGVARIGGQQLDRGLAEQRGLQDDL